MEIWRNVKGSFGCYKISNLGNVYSCRGGVNNTKRQRRPWITTGGYLCTDIIIHERRHTSKVHRLVAEAFLPNPEKYRVVNHKDGNKQNNRVDNLEWCDHSHNNQHAWDTGLRLKTLGENHPQSKLTQEQADEIRSLKKSGVKRKQLCELYSVSISVIDKVVSYRQYCA